MRIPIASGQRRKRSTGLATGERRKPSELCIFFCVYCWQGFPNSQSLAGHQQVHKNNNNVGWERGTHHVRIPLGADGNPLPPPPPPLAHSGSSSPPFQHQQPTIIDLDPPSPPPVLNPDPISFHLPTRPVGAPNVDGPGLGFSAGLPVLNPDPNHPISFCLPTRPVAAPNRFHLPTGPADAPNSAGPGTGFTHLHQDPTGFLAHKKAFGASLGQSSGLRSGIRAPTSNYFQLPSELIDRFLKNEEAERAAEKRVEQQKLHELIEAVKRFGDGDGASSGMKGTDVKLEVKLKGKHVDLELKMKL